MIANILAAPLVALAPGIAKISAQGAPIILSGLLNTQAVRVMAAYRRQGMRLRDKIVRGDWSTLILERN